MHVYGADIADSTWKDDVIKTLKTAAFRCGDKFRDLFEEYCKENDISKDDADSFGMFVDGYESEYGGSDIAGLATDIINEVNFSGDAVFRCGYDSIYVEPYIPQDDDEKKRLPSVKRIKTILAEHLNPLLTEPVVLNWLDVSDDDCGY